MHEGRLMAEVVRTEACQSCRACNFGQQERVYIDIGALKCHEGDTVNIDIDDGSVPRASVIAYGLPVAAFFGGLLIGSVFTQSDYILALCALAGMAAGLAAVKLADRRARRSGRYTPKVTLSNDTPEKMDI